MNPIQNPNGPTFNQWLEARTQKKQDWIKIASIVVIAVGALFLLLGGLCAMEIFPSALLGGYPGIGISLIIGACLAAPAALVLYFRFTGKLPLFG